MDDSTERQIQYATQLDAIKRAFPITETYTHSTKSLGHITYPLGRRPVRNLPYLSHISNRIMGRISDSPDHNHIKAWHGGPPTTTSIHLAIWQGSSARITAVAAVILQSAVPCVITTITTIINNNVIS